MSTDLNTLINTPGWHLTFAERINNNGLIVGTGTMNGQQTGFLLVPWAYAPPPRRHWVLPVPGLILTILFGIIQDGGGWAIPVGPVPPWGPIEGTDTATAWEAWLQISEAKRDALIALALDEVAMYITERAAREKVRRLLVEVSRDRLNQLMASAAKGRSGPGTFRPAGPTRRKLMLGRPETSLARFRFGPTRTAKSAPQKEERTNSVEIAAQVMTPCCSRTSQR